MSIYEIGAYEPPKKQWDIHGPITDWREALARHQQLQTAFNDLDEEGRALLTRRLDLQISTRQAQEELVRSKAVFDGIITQRILGSLIDAQKLEQARTDQTEAFARCVATIAAVIDVESHLCMRNLPSEPYLNITQRRDGQALADNYPVGTSMAFPDVVA